MVGNILKWQGGKSKLFRGPIQNYLSPELFDPSCDITFIDAFAGGGSVFLYVLQNCPGVKRILINDWNYKLIELYYTIKEDVAELIRLTGLLQDGYTRATNKEEYYLKVRDTFNGYNLWSNNWGYKERSAALLFLSRSCFNGIYRENQKHGFNVPWCKKDSITVLYESDLRDASALLNNPSVDVRFCYGDFSYIDNYVTPGNTFVYFDPPYRPLSGTNSFTEYTSSPFNDDTQRKLKDYCDYLQKVFGTKVMISNSYDPNDSFIPDLYKDYNVYQISASRSSGGKNATRGKTLENLITNY